MANSDYTFRDVVLGTGSFSMEGDTGYSNGVNTLQQYLRRIGYTIRDSSGRFQSGTRNAVIGFQNEMGITANGIAGQHLQAVECSIHVRIFQFVWEADYRFPVGE